MADEDDRGGSTAVRARRRDAPPAPRTAPAPPRGRLMWLMVALVAAGTLLLVTWALFQVGELGGTGDLAPASPSHQVLMDQVAPKPFVPAPSEGSSSGYTGDWKDSVGSGSGQGEATSGYTGDWKDQVGSETGQGGTASSSGRATGSQHHSEPTHPSLGGGAGQVTFGWRRATRPRGGAGRPHRDRR